MGAISGLNPIQNYAGAANNKARVALLTALIANPDTTSSSGATAGGAANTYLDEMSPGAAAQLRVELAALEAAIANV